ncbi:MAG: 16S rRNA (cytosine(1402)-N(4))-methyltransferase RsmH [Acholeplasmatales bacterium]|jgi:16S rRNA (cytosine1402-N4)-methyltransferase|nr:16S rRNA (cytosine(1402)-N(4))-methyltransferase RsmH [Acholeplasmatales bacterium]
MKHYSVMLKETIDALNVSRGGIYVDATTGGAGHSQEILKRLAASPNGGFLYCFEIDEVAIQIIKDNLAQWTGHFEIIPANFKDLKAELQKRQVSQIDGIIYDLGLSSFQIDDPQRGFSYMNNGVIDMRMDLSSNFSALDIINTYTYEQLRDIFFKYGEEENSIIIAKRIIEHRPLQLTNELVEITDKVNRGRSGHSAKKIFQALRIATNDELNNLQSSLDQALALLRSGGIIACLTFHSLEDRIVKHFFMDQAKIDMPLNIDIRGLIPPLEIITKHPLLPSESEKKENSRSLSAKLRVARKN